MKRVILPIYAFLVRFYQYVYIFGIAGVGVRARELMGDQGEVVVQSRRFQFTATLRLNSRDMDTLLKVFYKQEYDFEVEETPDVIIDAGANIGLSALFFAYKYPTARIIAIEAEASNYRLLARNVEARPMIHAVEAALWRDDAVLEVHDRHTGSWGFAVREKGEPVSDTLQTVQGVTVSRLMEEFEVSFVDLLKVDIEGGEKEVFEASAEWIDRVGVIVAETHDRIKPGCRHAFREATHAFGHWFEQGENIVVMRDRYVPAS